mmetsp:Transcript_62060/g.71133  ORF Transcript_62060/g.71133 Transcript_62060/m.71133 type:complete len:202 (+) Transcript_62060:1208-1813(+)
MTEIGMGLSNPYEGLRQCGSVGTPLPGVEAKIVDENGEECPLDTPGSLLIKSPALFTHYWNREEVTKESFTEDGFFMTGDTVSKREVRSKGEYFFIEGRTSVDILKSGGYKLSALEIESILLEHPNIVEIAVLGLPDDYWGQKVAGVVATRDGDFQGSQVEEWASERMAKYKIPRCWYHIDAIPRNAMGKVNKKELSAIFN